MLVKIIPNLLTFLNLSLGSLSILAMINQNYWTSALLIIIAAFIDRYDGRIAKFFNASSELGKELDSLADLVSFGVAPALLIYSQFNFLGFSKVVGISLLLIYIISGCYRLAKYNVSTFDGVFIGVPITVAGFILAMYSLAAPSNNISTLISMFVLAVLAYLMISKFKFKKI